MGIFSSSLSVSRYRVTGDIEEPVHERILAGLTENRMPEIEDDMSETVTGWTSFESPFRPKFDDYSFVIGETMVFSLRIDKKTIPPKLIHKNVTMALAERAAASGQAFLSKSEKESIKEEVIFTLSRRIPATPNVYDLIWNYGRRELWFFSTLKSANEELETLFIKSFRLSLMRFFPYTAAGAAPGMTDARRDRLNDVQPVKFF